MATNIVQMTDGSGNKQYPVTSAEAVGMPDGSGNLQNYLNKRVTELNISVLYPTQGIGGTNKYDLATAIAQVPSEYRTIQGVKITFINNETGKTETWVYDGGTFTTVSNWKLSNDSEKLDTIQQDVIKYSYAFGKNDLTGNWTQNRDGKIAYSSGSSFDGLSIAVSKGDTFIISTRGGLTGRAWFVADENNNILAEAEGNLDTTSNPLSLTIEQDNASRLFVNLNTVEPYLSKFSVIYINSAKHRVDKLEQNIQDTKIELEQNIQDSIQDEVPTIVEELISDTDISVGITGFWQSNEIGIALTPISYESLKRSELIECAEGDQFEVTLKSGAGNSRAWAFADVDNIVISNAEKNVLYTNELITAPTNAKYVAFTEADITGVNHTTKVIKKAKFPTLTKEDLDKEIEGVKTDVTQQINNNPAPVPIKILMIGNSFTLDALCLVPYMIKKIIPSLDITLGIVYNGGASLQMYDENFFVNATNDDYVKFNSKSDEHWTTSNVADINDILSDEDWDIITFQQSSFSANNYSTFEPYLSNLIKKIYSLGINNSVKIGWLLTTPRADDGADGTEYFNKQVEAIQEVLKTTLIDIVIPCGTALQNCRTIESFNSIGSEGYMMTSDHLQKGIPHMIEAYAFVQWLLDYSGILKGVYCNKWRPEDNTSWIIDSGGGVQGITEDNCRIAQIAAIKAVNKPFEITDLNSYL